MDLFNKQMAQQMLGKMVEKKSGEGINPVENHQYTREFLASMSESEFLKFVERVKEEGDKDKLAMMLSNWPFKKD